MEEKVFVSWSGGKDSYLSFLKAKEEGLDVQYLLNFMGQHGRSMSHGVSEEILRDQARALEIPLVTERVTWGSYEKGFLRAVGKLKEQGITGGVFGDINLPEHREWQEKMCGSLGLTAYLPLWGMEEDEVVNELIARGSRLLVVSLDKEALPREWLGKEVDKEFLVACQEAGISPCGERGEYHTLAVGGPHFKAPLELIKQGSHLVGNKYFLKIVIGAAS